MVRHSRVTAPAASAALLALVLLLILGGSSAVATADGAGAPPAPPATAAEPADAADTTGVESNGYTSDGELHATRAPVCRATGIAVKSAGATPAAPVAEGAYNQSGVEQHFELTALADFRPHDRTTFACVDSRSEGPVLGTPGGDFAELVGAIAAYARATGGNATERSVADVFGAFMRSGVVTPARPFYFHTSDEKLHAVFDAVAADGVVPRPTVLPVVAPANATEREVWLDHLTEGAKQGCGHVRLMIDSFADYGLKSADIPRALIRAFFEYWWPTPPGSPERGLVRFDVLQGKLDGKAVAIVDADGCAGASPAVAASRGGSQVFVYDAGAAADFREAVLAPFFEHYAAASGAELDGAKFRAELRSLQAQQLGATLRLLPPANALPQWAVKVTAAGPQT